MCGIGSGEFPLISRGNSFPHTTVLALGQESNCPAGLNSSRDYFGPVSQADLQSRYYSSANNLDYLDPTIGKATNKKPDLAPTPKPKLKYLDGVFYLDFKPDYELGIRSLRYEIILDDGVNESVRKELVIDVLDDSSEDSVPSSVNSVPVITSNHVYSIPNNTTEVAIMSAIDDDGDLLEFSLIGEDASEFTIHIYDGILALKNSSDYFTKNSYTFDLIVTDLEEQSTKSITVNVANPD